MRKTQCRTVCGGEAATNALNEAAAARGGSAAISTTGGVAYKAVSTATGTFNVGA